jgi:hypothetical protein
VDLYGHDSGNCEPVSSMTEAEWSEFLTTFAHQQLWTQQVGSLGSPWGKWGNMLK